jgi:hypothetical protein
MVGKKGILTVYICKLGSLFNERQLTDCIAPKDWMRVNDELRFKIKINQV